MKVVLYLRYSSDKQTEQSIEGQLHVCEKYCEQNNMTIVDTYIDRALSASKDVEKRIAFQQMIKDSKKQNFQAVIVYKLDRFARSRYDSAMYKFKLKENGVNVISATENISDAPEGIILESVLEGMAEFYSRELLQKVRRGMNETAMKGNSCGGNIPLGYKIENKKFVIDKEKAEIVKEAFERYVNGEGIQEIIADFNARGLKNAKGNEFKKNSFQNIFSNKRYIGTYTYKDIAIDNAIPAIIDKETFKKAQIRLKNQALAAKPRQNKINYLLSQKIFCGHCSSLMNGEYGTSKNGKQYCYYVCADRRKTKTCDKKKVNKDWIERTVVENTLALITPDKICEYAEIAVKEAERETAKNTDVQKFTKELENTEKAIANLIKLIETGIEFDMLTDRINELKKIRETNIKNLNYALTDVIKLDKTEIIFFLSKLTTGDINDENYRRRIIDMFVNSVTVWDEPDGYFKITITYNITSMKTKPFKCSSENQFVPPKKHPYGCFFYSHCITTILSFFVRESNPKITPHIDKNNSRRQINVGGRIVSVSIFI